MTSTSDLRGPEIGSDPPSAGQTEPGALPRSFRGPGGELPLRADDGAARDLVMLIAGETSGRPLAEILAEFGVSRRTYYEKRRRYRAQGLTGLLPRPRGPRSPSKRSLEVLRLIVTARLRDPRRTSAAIAAYVERKGYDVSVRSVERTLSEFGLTGDGRPQP